MKGPPSHEAAERTREGEYRTPMTIIWPSPLDPSTYAAAGQQIQVPAQLCPSCRGRLIGWGGYWRWVRSERHSEQRIWIRRGWCARCRHAHALLPSFLLVHRLDAVAVIGAGLDQLAAGAGARRVAQQLALAHTTVRDWWRRVRVRAPALLPVLLALATSLDPAPVVLVMAGAAAVVEAVRCAWQRAQQRLGHRTPDPWALLSLISGGLALAPHTSPPLPGGP